MVLRSCDEYVQASDKLVQLKLSQNKGKARNGFALCRLAPHANSLAPVTIVDKGLPCL